MRALSFKYIERCSATTHQEVLGGGMLADEEEGLREHRRLVALKQQYQKNW